MNREQVAAVAPVLAAIACRGPVLLAPLAPAETALAPMLVVLGWLEQRGLIARRPRRWVLTPAGRAALRLAAETRP